MKRILGSKAFCALCQVLVMASLGSAWLIIADSFQLGIVAFCFIGVLLFGLCFICLMRTVRSPFEEEYPSRINMIFHIVVCALYLISVVLYGKKYGFVPDMAKIARLLSYDFDDGAVYAIMAVGSLVSLVGATASAMIVSMCIFSRRGKIL